MTDYVLFLLILTAVFFGLLGFYLGCRVGWYSAISMEDEILEDKKKDKKMNEIETLQNHIKELEATISKLEKVAPKWISVNGKLPPEGMVVIAFSPQGVFPAYYESYSHKDFAWWIDGNPVCNVTHWMPLPPPPTTEDSSVTEKEK